MTFSLVSSRSGPVVGLGGGREELRSGVISPSKMALGADGRQADKTVSVVLERSATLVMLQGLTTPNDAPGEVGESASSSSSPE